MPNWVATIMEITGEPEELERFRKGVKVSTREEPVYDFSKEYGSQQIGTREVEVLSILDGFVPIPEELYEVTHPVRAEQEELAQKMVDKYGFADWYNWQYENWGVKWGDCHTQLDDEQHDEPKLVYRFDTPWGTAEKGFLQISKMFPTLRFQFRYDEEAGFFAGSHVMRNGEILYEGMFAPCEYEEEVDWDDEESMRKYDEWKYENQDRIDDEADMVA